MALAVEHGGSWSAFKLDGPVESYKSFDAAVKLQKVFRGHRERRSLADSALLSHELWWQATDHVKLNLSTISFFNSVKSETAIARWKRITSNASKVGKGLIKDPNAHKLSFRHWIEAIDPRHRYGKNLQLYYQEWGRSNSDQPFFYWLDIGDGKEVNLEECPRSKLQEECVKYLGPKEREHYEYIIIEGKIVHKKTGNLFQTSKDSEWIFVMCTDKRLYCGEGIKGRFHHSSFLAGGAALVGGDLIVENGILKFVSRFSGHYLPTGDKLDSFLSLLKENGVNLDQVEVKHPSK